MNFFVPEATPVRVAGVLQTLQATGPVSPKRLEFLLAPPGVNSDASAGVVVDRLTESMEQARLIELMTKPEERFRLHPSLGSVEALSYRETLRLLAHRLIGKGVEDPTFALLIAWYLDQPLTKLPSKASELNQRCTRLDEFGMVPLSDSQFRHFLDWSKALGLLTPLSIGRKEELILVVVNLVPFFRRHLDELMKFQEPISAPEWLETLSDTFPIFDGGSIRERIRKSEDQILSASLTFAIRQLSDAGILSLEDRKDAPRLRLRIGRQEQSFSHLTWMKRGAE
jgi:hypothetical protein